MRKKSPRKKAVERLDKAFSRYVRQRDKECVLCRSKENLQCGHLITRSKYSTRWHILNGFCQCRSCNFLHESQPERFTAWFLRVFGKKAYEALVKESNQIRKFSTEELIAMAEEYENNLKGEK